MFLPFYEDPDWVSHELAGHLEDLVRQCGGDETHLCGWGKVAVHIVDLFFKTYKTNTSQLEIDWEYWYTS